MPRNTREWSRRKLDMAIGNIDSTLQHLREVIETYEKEVPRVSEPLDIIAQVLISVQENITAVKESY